MRRVSYNQIGCSSDSSSRLEQVARANCLARLEVLSYNATAGVTLQLPCMLHMCATFGESQVVSQSRDPIARLFLSAHS